MGKMKFHIYGQRGLADLPDSTTIEDLRSLASFNRIIKNYTKMERIENENKYQVMINIDSLPKSIKYNGEVYFLNLHVTAFNKICVCYQYAFSPMEAHEKNIEYNILSQVVEPDCVSPNYTDEITGIVDVKSWEQAFEALSARLNTALANEQVKIYK